MVFSQPMRLRSVAWMPVCRGWKREQGAHARLRQNWVLVSKKILNVPDNHPHELLREKDRVGNRDSSMRRKLAFGVGARYETWGLMVWRRAEKFGTLESPSQYALEAWQDRLKIGGEAERLDPALRMNAAAMDSIAKQED